MLRKALFLMGCIAFLGGCVSKGDRTNDFESSWEYASGLTLVDRSTLIGPQDLFRDMSATHSEGTINVVVEIPTGSTEKWEVDKNHGGLSWELVGGVPRRVSYLGYPGNYGMLPQSLLPADEGGDGVPLDVIVLGDAVPRGSIVTARPIGVLKLLDRGERDDKILAVQVGSAFEGVSRLEDLTSQFHGVVPILQIWFRNYKGRGLVELSGMGDELEAKRIIQYAISAYRDRLDPKH